MADDIKELAGHQAQEPGDDIVKPLCAFLIYLPDNGGKNFIDDINHAKSIKASTTLPSFV